MRRIAPLTPMHMPLTILSWDIAGSCALLSTLDLDTYCRVVRACQEKAAAAVEAQGGFVARFMGDGLLAYFGFPRPDGDEADRAVRAALATPLHWRQGGVTIRSRVAIASGPVIVGAALGRDAAREFPAFGEAASLAARLLDVTPAEDVVIDSATRDALCGRFVCDRLDGLSLKGFPHVSRAWRVTSAPAAGPGVVHAARNMSALALEGA
jgi:class 3 adenylate cyclase